MTDTVRFDKLVERSNHALTQRLLENPPRPTHLQDAMRYSVLAGGKRLRPLLVYAAAMACGGDNQQTWDTPACAVEFIHTYSLIHDDLPAMDNDSLRRGNPTCHVKFGEAMAILAGDALQALAFEILACDQTIDVAVRTQMVAVLGKACGSAGMAGGQVIDIEAATRHVDQAALEHMHALKTGALINAAVALGALAGGNQDDKTRMALDRYAQALGLAFQIRDDILDSEGDSKTLGKTAGKDQAQNKATFITMLGYSASKHYLEEKIQQALESLEGFGQRADLLRQLAKFTAARNN